MFPSGQSAGVAQEHQEERLSPPAVQRHRVPVQVLQLDGRDLVTDGGRSHRYGALETSAVLSTM